MKSIVVEKDPSQSCQVFYISDISEEMKILIRENLQSICHGIKEGAGYNYKNTLKDFLDRYETKSNEIKMGMVGELLTHVLFLSEQKNMCPASMFFNMEERSVKKGFDVVLFEEISQEIWLTEVKSGSGDKKTAKDKNKDLLQSAKKDIHEKVTSLNSTPWHNAINGALLSVKKKRVKEEIVRILNDALAVTHGTSQQIQKKNVVLVSVLYKKLDEKIAIQDVLREKETIEEEKLFARVILVSFQKATYQKVVDFLKAEQVA